MLSKNSFQARLSSLFQSPQRLQQEVEDTGDCPPDIVSWMGRLQLLYGVPLNYLVPDERMLPPESIRFFYLDHNWCNALADGAFSIGRNLSIKESTPSLLLDRASTPMLRRGSHGAAARIRSRMLGRSAPQVDFTTITGFLLRSSIVQNYPGIGVNPYPVNGTPDKDPADVVLLDILRMERLGPDSDTLICLIAGDAYRIDIHEAPEGLHYGINDYSNVDGNLIASKTIYPFTKTGNPSTPSVTMNMKDPKYLNLADGCFRSSDARTMNMQALAGMIAQNQNPPIASVDAAEMGFEMIEGVGMVSFYNTLK